MSQSWRDRCDKSWCQYAAELLRVWGGFSLIYGVFKLIPAIAECKNELAFDIAFVLLGLIGIGGAVCIAAKEDEKFLS